jgi:hypothetical protein
MSVSLTTWSTTRKIALDEMEAAHRGVGGTGRGRRYATQQINQAYAILVSSHFQGYSRDLHSECVEHLVRSVAPGGYRITLRRLLTQDRKLDKGNPNPGNIGSDFATLGLSFWPTVLAVDSRNNARHQLLEELNVWRNAIAHQDFTSAKLLGKTTVTLQQARAWRSACASLAVCFDRVMYDHMLNLTGQVPW